MKLFIPLDQCHCSFRALLAKANLVLHQQICKFPLPLRSALRRALYEHPRKQFVNPIPTTPPNLYLLPTPKPPVEDPQILVFHPQLLFLHNLSLPLPYRPQSTTSEGVPLNLL